MMMAPVMPAAAHINPLMQQQFFMQQQQQQMHQYFAQMQRMNAVYGNAQMMGQAIDYNYLLNNPPKKE